MLMDFELHSTVNAKIAQIVSEQLDEGLELDLVITQTDKYENTPYECVTIGLGSSKGMKTDEYYFNALEDEDSRLGKIAGRYYNEPVSYYERIGSPVSGGYISHVIQVHSFSRVIEVYQVGYTAPEDNLELNHPTRHLVETIKLGKSKFASKVKKATVV